MSKPWEPAYIRSSSWMKLRTLSFARPETTIVVKTDAIALTLARISSDMKALSGCSTIGESVPS